MQCFWNAHRANLVITLSALALAAVFAAAASAAAPRPDEKELLAAGFKVLVATTSVQKDWVRGLPPGQIRPMQRNGKKYFIYPDASNSQIYVGGTQEYDAYRERHPQDPKDAPEAASAASRAYRAKQDSVMLAATARDLSDPFLGVTWADLGW